MPQLRMTLRNEPAALCRVLNVLTRKQCDLTHVSAHAAGSGMHVRVVFAPRTASATHVTQLLAKLDSVLHVAMEDSAVRGGGR